MKLNFIYPPRPGRLLSPTGADRRRRGIALIITLIMLSVTLVMAVAFLALARRERRSVGTTTDTTTARLAADSALAAAQSQIMANLLATNAAAYESDLVVSTNFYNAFGFVPGLANPTNVNYFYTSANTALAPADLVQNVANLQYFPRVPVYVQTNPGSPLDFRFYLDLNRNGQFDDTGNHLPDILADGATNGFGIQAVGDPQWVGVLARPDTMHSANNQFVARYAFAAIPIGNGLDLNAIHNNGVTAVDSAYNNAGSSAYLRNEGVGSWELNLAAFLTDLNTNQWDVPGVGNYYNYLEPTNKFNTGAAFDNALSLLSYRYNYSLSSLYPISRLFNNSLTLMNQPFDLNSTGPVLERSAPLFYLNDNTTLWAGSPSTNRFYDLPSELYNPLDSSTNFTGRLLKAGTENGSLNPSTYDRYTFYRMLEQMGTDSDADRGKMNLNYRNITNGVVVAGYETNLVPWQPLDFFTNAADRMLKVYTTNWFAANPQAYLQTYYGLLPDQASPLPPYYYKDAYRNQSGVLVTNDPSGFGLTNVSLSRFLGWTNRVPAFGITNIPVYINGQFVYSPAVNRVLQLAANLFEASTNEFYPQVFRPVFELDRFTNLFIVGYTNVGPTDPANLPFYDPQFLHVVDVSQLSSPALGLPIDLPLYINVYGVPWIIGAKPGFPAFNQLALLNTVQVTRRLQLRRDRVGDTIYTNHMYLLSISNVIGASFWNSYSNDYYPAGNLQVEFFDDVQFAVRTNMAVPLLTSGFTNSFSYNLTAWPGSQWTHRLGEAPAVDSFVAKYWANTITNAIYKTEAGVFAPTNDPDNFETNFPQMQYSLLPPLYLLTTNWMRAAIVDNGHVIDYVQLRGPMDVTNFTAVLYDPPGSTLWATNAFGGTGGPSYGFVSQINISSGNPQSLAGAHWQPFGYPANFTSKGAAQSYFKGFLTPGNNENYSPARVASYATNLTVQAGYTTTRTIFVPYLYQVNDPLVHYLASDLDAGAGAVWNGSITAANGLWRQSDGLSQPVPVPVIPHDQDIIHGRYQPWGAVAPTVFQVQGYNFYSGSNSIYKDPGVWDPDYWNFPANKYPTVGWIGRVHRGTPWQTVYLKATNVLAVPNALSSVGGVSVGLNTWAAWTGDHNYYDAAASAPVEDRLLFDVFTARPNDNAARGTLSVNQTHLAAWSALFSGMAVLTNVSQFRVALGDNLSFPVASNSYFFVQPAGAGGGASQLGRLVAAINQQRAAGDPAQGFTNVDGVRAFEHVGDILSTPALSQQSPFLNWSNSLEQAYGLSDADYEWLPQQMMGLVRASVTPRYVVYGYGQALRPAPNGLVTSGADFGLVTNYQVVAESAVRAVVSVAKQVDLTGPWPVTNYTTRVESYNVLPSD